MAMSACYGGPLLSTCDATLRAGGQLGLTGRGRLDGARARPWRATDLLLGLGIGFTVNIGVNGGNPYELAATTVLILSMCGLLLVLVYSMAFVVINKFRVNRVFAISLIGIYLALVIVDVAIEISGL